MNSIARASGTLTFVAALGALPARTAHASESGVANAAPLALTALMVAPPVLIFGLADLAYATEGQWTPRGWAISEIAVGSLVVGLGVPWAVSPYEGYPAVSAMCFIPGALMVTHGIASLVLRRAPQAPVVSFAPSYDGGAVVVSGRF